MRVRLRKVRVLLRKVRVLLRKVKAGRFEPKDLLKKQKVSAPKAKHRRRKLMRHCRMMGARHRKVTPHHEKLRLRGRKAKSCRSKQKLHLLWLTLLHRKQKPRRRRQKPRRRRQKPHPQ